VSNPEVGHTAARRGALATFTAAGVACAVIVVVAIGVGALLNGLCWGYSDDDDRLRAGCALLDALHESLTRQTRRMTAV
jgi:hypothetical protein